MKKIRLWLGAVVFGAFICVVPILQAQASTIDTTVIDSGTIFNYGYENTATYGQTFNLAGQSNLNSFSLFLRDRYDGSGTLDLRGYVAGWDGNKATSILYESSTQTMNAAGDLQEFYFDTGSLSLLGGDYVAFLSISNLGVQNISQFGMPFSSDLIDGQFVFINNGTNFAALTTDNWSLNWVGQQDAWFKADIAPVPEPSTFILLGAGLAGLAAMGIRRRKN